jgi:hypothetical protein
MVLFFKLIFVIFVMGFVCVSQQGESKTPKKVLEEVHVKSFWPKKLRNKTFFLSYFPSIFLIAFLAVSLHEEPRNTIKIFSKIRPENLKKNSKQATMVPTSLPRPPPPSPAPLAFLGGGVGGSRGEGLATGRGAPKKQI